MSREQDVLFCKIAITAGFVQEPQARKCLTICERREKEGKRRPMIGAVFTKYNLMRNEDVQRVYEAVNKRLGQSGRRPGSGTTTIRPGSTTVRRLQGSDTIRQLKQSAESAPRNNGPGLARRTRYGHRGSRRPKKLDRNTVLMGAGFGVVFLGIIGAIVALYVRSPGLEDDAAADADSQPGSKVMSASSAETPKPTVTEIEEAERRRLQAETVDEEFRNRHKRALNNARNMAYVQNRPDLALEELKVHYERNRTEYDHGAPELKKKFDDAVKELRGLSSGGGSGEAEEEATEDLLDEGGS